MAFAKNLRKTVSKHASNSVHEGFYEGELWVGCGNYAMNRLMTGRFDRAFQYGRSALISGQSGSAKSLVAATAAILAQKAGAVVVWLDAEKASKKEWLERLGMDTSPEKLVYFEVATIGDVKKLVSDIVKELSEDQAEKRVPVFVVVDSYSALLTDKQWDEAEGGDLVGDQGQHAKQLKDLIKAVTHLVSRLPIAVVGMVHSMASSDKYNPDDILLGGRGLEYMASLVIMFSKLKLKADNLEDTRLQDEYEDGKKIVGIRCKAQIYKSRFSKPNENVFVQIPYPHGLDPYSGLFDLFLADGTIEMTSPGWYSYVVPGPPVAGRADSTVKFQKSKFREHADTIMSAVTNAEALGKAGTKAVPKPEEAAENAA